MKKTTHNWIATAGYDLTTAEKLLKALVAETNGMACQIFKVTG